MRRGEIWLAHVGRKRRPVVVLTRDGVIDLREQITVAEVTTSVRGLAVEVELDADVGVDRASVVNCDGIYTIARAGLSGPIGELDDDAMRRVCSALTLALGC